MEIKTNIEYSIYTPGGNTTALVAGLFDAQLRVKISKAILARHAEVEQVGFYDVSDDPNADFRLEMMGGEFCGNAARSLAFMHGQKKPCVRLMVSGCPFVLYAHAWEQESIIRLPKSFVDSSVLHDDFAIVRMRGIAFLVAFREIPKQDYLDLVKRYRRDEQAFGVIEVNCENAQYAIRPWVWVSSVDTAFHETACGSGSIAAAYVIRLLKRADSDMYQILQPSGRLLTTQFLGEEILLQGPVEFVAAACMSVAQLTIQENSIQYN